MYKPLLATAVVCVFLSGCTREDDARTKAKLHEAGQELKQDTEKATRELKKDLHEAGNEIREGSHKAARDLKSTGR